MEKTKLTRRHFSGLAFILLFLTAVTWIAGCGQVCLGGFGNCGQSPPNPVQTLTLNFTSGGVYSGYPAYLYATGGTSPYTVTITDQILQSQNVLNPPTIATGQYSTFSAPTSAYLPTPFNSDSTGTYSTVHFKLADNAGGVATATFKVYVQ